MTGIKPQSNLSSNLLDILRADLSSKENKSLSEGTGTSHWMNYICGLSIGGLCEARSGNIEALNAYVYVYSTSRKRGDAFQYPHYSFLLKYTKA
jgi:hypothetical protein